MPIYVNDHLINSFKFPGGEVQVRLPIILGRYYELDYVRVCAVLNSSDAIMELLLTVDAIRRSDPNLKINLTIPYFPYARQDRVCGPDEALSVKVMADIINSLNCRLVKIYDPHSDVVGALIKNIIIVDQRGLIWETKFNSFISGHDLGLVAPDAGASKKINSAAYVCSKQDNYIPEIFQGYKDRDVVTGKISNIGIIGDVSGKNLVIIDDICDGGATFLSLGKVLKDKGAKDLYLYVTHGIFSKGLSELRTLFKHVYCYHSLHDQFKNDRDFLTIYQEIKYENKSPYSD